MVYFCQSDISHGCYGNQNLEKKIQGENLDLVIINSNKFMSWAHKA